MSTIPPFLPLVWNHSLSDWSFLHIILQTEEEIPVRGSCIFLIQFKRLPSGTKPVAFAEFPVPPDFQTQVTNAALGNDSILNSIWKLFLGWDFREIKDLKKESVLF